MPDADEGGLRGGCAARWPTAGAGRDARGPAARTSISCGACPAAGARASGKGLIERGHSGPRSGLHGRAVQCAGRPPFVPRHKGLIGENSIADIRVVHTWGAASTVRMLGAGRACGTGRASPTRTSGNTGRTCGVGRASSGARRASATATAAPGCADREDQHGQHGQLHEIRTHTIQHGASGCT